MDFPDNFWMIFPIVVVMFTAFSVADYIRKINRTFRTEITQQMLKRGGRFTNGSYFLHYQDLDLRVYFGKLGTSGPYYTFVRTELKKVLGFNFFISPKGGIKFITKMMGLKDVKIGDPVFENVFSTDTNREDKTRRFLSPGLKERLLKIKDMNPQCLLEDKTIQLYVSGLGKTQTEYDALIEAGLGLIDCTNKI